jgi:RHS repeat-associated protein
MVYGFGQELAEDQPGMGTTFIQGDFVGSPSVMTDANGIVIGRSKNLPFGERMSAWGSKTVRRYTNHEDDTDSNAIYMQAREYLPAYGKFAQVDPAYDQTKDDPESWNLYNYVTNNPVTHTDPDGRIAFGVDPDYAANVREVDAFTYYGQDLATSYFDTNPIAASEWNFAVGAMMSNWNYQFALELQSAGFGDPGTQNWVPAVRDASGALVPGQSSPGVAQTGLKAKSGPPQSGPDGKAIQSGPETTNPQSLTATTIPRHVPTALDIKWPLAKPSAQGGWIVQAINLTALDGSLIKHFWEAWQVRAGETTIIYNIISAYDDRFQAPIGQSVPAHARFFEGLTLPASFIPYNPNANAHTLPSTTINPDLSLANATASVNRSWTAHE